MVKVQHNMVIDQRYNRQVGAYKSQRNVLVQSWPQGYKHFLMLNSTEPEI